MTEFVLSNTLIKEFIINSDFYTNEFNKETAWIIRLDTKQKTTGKSQSYFIRFLNKGILKTFIFKAINLYLEESSAHEKSGFIKELLEEVKNAAE